MLQKTENTSDLEDEEVEPSSHDDLQKNTTIGGYPSQKSLQTDQKDFIQRNIVLGLLGLPLCISCMYDLIMTTVLIKQLAERAMSKFALTDDEKQQLEQILSDIDNYDFEQTKSDADQLEESEAVNSNESINAFHIKETDRQRICEIDLKLENDFSETQHLRPKSCDLGEDFWKSLTLEKSLSNIDVKLAAIKEKDDVKEELEINVCENVNVN